METTFQRSQRSQRQRSLRQKKIISAIVFHIITMFAGIAELSFPLGDRSDRQKPGFIFLFKCIKGNGPDCISNVFEPRLLRYNLRNSEYNLTQQSYNHRFYLTYKAQHLWNQLPSYIKKWAELNEFHKNLRPFNIINSRDSCKCNFCNFCFYDILELLLTFFFLGHLTHSQGFYTISF